MDTTRAIETYAEKDVETKPSIKTFSPEVIEYLRSNGSEMFIAAGTVIIREGMMGTAFYVILSGEIEVRLHGADGRVLPVTRMGKHSGFGEMSLLRGEPTAAEIVALTPSVVLEYPEKNFHKALGESEAFRNELMARMAQNIFNTSREALSFYQRAEAFDMLLHKEVRHSEPLVSKSDKMRAVEKKIIRLSQGADPVLVMGEPGTGKLFAARKIHNLSAKPDAPFIVIDCSKLDETEACGLLFGSSHFGDAARFEKFGILHLAHEGTLVLRNIDALDQNCMNILLLYLDLHSSEGKAAFPYARIVGTTKLKPSDLQTDGQFHHHLWETLSANTLRIPALRERRADILPMAAIFLGQLESEEPKYLSQSAEDVLLSLQYRNNNAKELRESVELAALFADSGEILGEHIFAGPKDKKTPPEYDLGDISLIRRMIRSKEGSSGPGILTLVRVALLAVFATIILLCLGQGSARSGQVANTMIWAVWEPLLIFAFLFTGHLWCAVCPLSTAARVVQRLVSFKFKRPPAQWIKNYGVWFAIAGFFLIIWSEKVFHMTANPAASGILLLSLVGSAVVFSMIYQREAWCRYICPLGALASAYSLPGLLQVRAKSHVCATYCTTHECYKGTAESEGCPVFHHPLYLSDGHNCKLCFKCLDLCPHGSPSLYLRPPLQAVWLFGGFARIMMPFALSVFALSIVMLASNGSQWLKGPVELTVVALAAVFTGILLNSILPHLLSDYTGSERFVSSRVSFGLLILAWGPLMAYQLDNIPGLSSLRFYAQPDSFLGKIFSTAGEVNLLVFLQLSLILLALLLAWVVFNKTQRHAENEGIRVKRPGWHMLLIISVLYALFAAGAVLMK